MYFYGTFLEEGKYVEQNPEESIKYYRNSANKQNVEAIRRYSCILDDEEKKRNYDEFKYNKNKEIKIKRRRRSFSFIDVDKSSIFSKLDDETCKIEFINAEYYEYYSKLIS